MPIAGEVKIAAAAIVLVCGIIAAACQGDVSRRVRSVTYPRDFHYITAAEIRTTMGGLAVEMVALDEILQKQGGPAAEDREVVVAILKRMNTLAGQLKKGARSNHPRIDRAAPRLRGDIERALGDAQSRSPNYYRAGRVVGACTYCHAPPPGATTEP